MKKLTISRRDAKAQSFEVNNCFISFVASASLREMVLFESEFFHTFQAPISPRAIPAKNIQGDILPGGHVAHIRGGRPLHGQVKRNADPDIPEPCVSGV